MDSTRVENTSTHLKDENALRFRAVVEEALEKLELLGVLTASVSRVPRVDDPKKDGEDIYALLSDQSQLEDRFYELMNRRGNLQGITNKSKAEKNETQLKNMAAELRSAADRIRRNLDSVRCYFRCSFFVSWLFLFICLMYCIFF